MTSCLSNQKQIGLGLQQYVTDYDEIMPTASQPMLPQIQPYLKATGIMICPSTQKGTINTSYVWNGFYWNEIPAWCAGSWCANFAHAFPWGENIRYFSSPSKTILIGDGLGQPGNGATSFDDANSSAGAYETGLGKDPPVMPDGTLRMFVARHQGGCNFVWADGHSKWMTLTQMASVKQCGSCIASGQYTYLMAQQE
jgi:prepilin-type processing-associated H-X9-DG protein